MEGNNHLITGLWVPIEVFANKNLSPTDKFLFAIINSLDGNNHCTASNAYLASVMNLTERSIISSLRNLEDNKYVIIDGCNGRRRTIRINPDYLKMYREVRNFFQVRPEKNFRHIIKDNNKSFSNEKDKIIPSDEGMIPSPEKPSDSVSDTNTAKTEEHALINQDICDAIISYWNSKGLRKHREGTKLYLRIISIMSRLTTGKFHFTEEYAKYNKVKFKRKDFIKAIDQFALAAIDPNYEAQEGSSYKQYLRKMSLADFIWNENAKERKSLFLYYLENDAKLLTDKFVKDENPDLTQVIADEFFSRQPNIDESLTPKKPFILAARRLKEFYKNNLSKMNHVILPSMNRLGKLLVEAVFENAKGKPVKASYLSSDITFGEILPLYLTNQNIMLEKRSRSSDMVYGNPYKPVLKSQPALVYKLHREDGQ
jgi:DNA-binding Lrp family transcriptional regulator